MMRAFHVATMVALLGGCSAIYPFELERQGDQGVQDAAPPQTDAGQRELGTDGPAPDAPAPDAQLPDAQVTPDTMPTLSTTACNNLWLGPVVPISDAKSAVEGRAPSVAAVNDVFYVAFQEGGEVHVKLVDPLKSGSFSKTALQLSGAGGKAGRPWITPGAQGKKLGVAWSEATTSCYGRLMFSEIQSVMLPSIPACNLSSKHATRGYGAPSLVHLGSKYTVAAPLYHTCPFHKKTIMHSFTPAATCASMVIPGATAYTSSISPTTCTQHLVLDAGSLSPPLRMVRTRTPVDAGDPASVEVYQYTSASGASWGVAGASIATAAHIRPALATDASGIWTSWTNTSKQVRLRYAGKATINDHVKLSPGAGTAAKARGSFLAASKAHGVTALVYGQLNAAGSKTEAVNLNLYTGGTKITHKLGETVAKAPAALGTNWQPTAPVVAAGKSGFGVAWVDLRSGNREVYFRLAGCL